MLVETILSAACASKSLNAFATLASSVRDQKQVSKKDRRKETNQTVGPKRCRSCNNGSSICRSRSRSGSSGSSRKPFLCLVRCYLFHLVSFKLSGIIKYLSLPRMSYRFLFLPTLLLMHILLRLPTSLMCVCLSGQILPSPVIFVISSFPRFISRPHATNLPESIYVVAQTQQ